MSSERGARKAQQAAVLVFMLLAMATFVMRPLWAADEPKACRVDMVWSESRDYGRFDSPEAAIDARMGRPIEGLYTLGPGEYQASGVGRWHVVLFPNGKYDVVQAAICNLKGNA